MIGLALQSRQAPAETGALGGIGATGGFSQDSMEPVKNLLSELIRRLEEEQSAETSHHDWCEEEKSTSTDAQAEREHQIHGLKEHVDQTTTTVSQRKSEVLFLQDELARVAKETGGGGRDPQAGARGLRARKGGPRRGHLRARDRHHCA